MSKIIKDIISNRNYEGYKLFIRVFNGKLCYTVAYRIRARNILRIIFLDELPLDIHDLKLEIYRHSKKARNILGRKNIK